MRKELTDIDKTVRKIKRLLDFHRKQMEESEIGKAIELGFDLFEELNIVSKSGQLTKKGV